MLRLLIFLPFLLLTFFGHSKTEKYRVMWRDDPSTTMVIGWVQSGKWSGTVYYGEGDCGRKWEQYPNKAGISRHTKRKGMVHCFVRLTGLKPNTRYNFVIKDRSGVSRRLWFQTAPNDPAERISFIAGGDSRNNREYRRNANKLVAKLRPHFVAFGGDMTNLSTSGEWKKWLEDWQLTITPDGKITPIIAARGNHERSNKDIDEIFDVPHPEVYYALTIGGSLLRMYTLNSEILVSGDQEDWLKKDLSNNQNVSWRIAQYHKPIRPHVSSKKERHDIYSSWAEAFYKQKVKLVIECDAHTAKTTWPVKPFTGSGSDEGFIRDDENGTTYVGEGCWGAPLRKDDDKKSWTRASGMFNQFKWIFVDKDKIEVRTVKTDNADDVGQVDQLNIFKTPAFLDIWEPQNGAVVTIK